MKIEQLKQSSLPRKQKAKMASVIALNSPTTTKSVMFFKRLPLTSNHHRNVTIKPQLHQHNQPNHSTITTIPASILATRGVPHIGPKHNHHQDHSTTIAGAPITPRAEAAPPQHHTSAGRMLGALAGDTRQIAAVPRV